MDRVTILYIFADSGEDHRAYLAFYGSLYERYARKNYKSKVLSQRTNWHKMYWDSKGLSFFVAISCTEIHHLSLPASYQQKYFFSDKFEKYATKETIEL